MRFYTARYYRVPPFHYQKSIRRCNFICLATYTVNRKESNIAISLYYTIETNPEKRKNTDSCFDVTMGSYDGAEICELFRTYFLSHLSKFIDKTIVVYITMAG